jgi:hypothetical protein
MNRPVLILLFLLGVFGFFPGCSSEQQAGTVLPGKLRVVIADEKLEGSPKEIISQLNILVRKYDEPTHEGITIRFDPAVDSQCCSLSIFRRGEPLVNWLRDVCEACGSSYRVDGTNVVIAPLPISEARTANIEAHLPNGMVGLCREFRSKRGQERFRLGEQLFQLLPRSPVTSSKDIGTGTIITYDYQKPSYKLHKRDVMSLLGQPDRNVNNERFCYSLRPDGGGFAELSVEFGKYDYAINPDLHWK